MAARVGRCSRLRTTKRYMDVSRYLGPMDHVCQGYIFKHIHRPDHASTSKTQNPIHLYIVEPTSPMNRNPKPTTKMSIPPHQPTPLTLRNHSLDDLGRLPTPNIRTNLPTQRDLGRPMPRHLAQSVSPSFPPFLFSLTHVPCCTCSPASCAVHTPESQDAAGSRWSSARR